MAELRTVTVDGLDEPLTVTYDASRYEELAGEMADVMTRAESGSDRPARNIADVAAREFSRQMRRIFAPVDGAVVAIERLVTDWDLVDENGIPLPVNEQTLDPLPIRTVILIGRAIDEDYFQSH
jgi:hypothetical protein